MSSGIAFAQRLKDGWRQIFIHTWYQAKFTAISTAKSGEMNATSAAPQIKAI